MQCIHHRPCQLPAAWGRQRSGAAVAASFSFANSDRANRPTGRRNRYVEKKQEDQLRRIAAGLCNFNGKQMQSVRHLLTDEHIKQIRIGSDIPPTNQGRKRQVGLVMGLLRSDLDESSLSKLSEAVQQAERFNLPYADRDVEQQLDVWLEGLVDNDQEVVSEVLELLQDRQQDWQQLRQWVRLLHQHKQQQQQQQQQDEGQGSHPAMQQPGDTSPLQQEDVPAAAVAAVAVADPEVLQLMQEYQQQQQGGSTAAGSSGSSSSKRSKGAKNPAAAARRSLRRMLQPLALQVL